MARQMPRSFFICRTRASYGGWTPPQTLAAALDRCRWSRSAAALGERRRLRRRRLGARGDRRPRARRRPRRGRRRRARGRSLDRLDPTREIEVHVQHQRFGAATVGLDGLRVDLTRTRRETYPRARGAARGRARPDRGGPAPARLHASTRSRSPCARRTSSSTPTAASPTSAPASCGCSTTPPSPTTPRGRSARPATPRASGYEPEPRTLELLRGTDLGTVSADRRDAELARLAAERDGARRIPAARRVGRSWRSTRSALELIDAIDRARLGDSLDADAATAAGRSCSRPDGGRALRGRAAALSRTESGPPLGGRAPRRRPLRVRSCWSQRRRGARWLAEYANEWSGVGLEIGGEDLIAAGVPEGPAIGIGLRGALERKLDGGLSGGREAELELAVALARGPAARLRSSATMDWREHDGIRWLEAELPSRRPRGVLDPARRGQRGRLREPQPRRPHRRRGRAACSRTAAGSARRWGSIPSASS